MYRIVEFFFFLEFFDALRLRFDVQWHSFFPFLSESNPALQVVDDFIDGLR